MLHLQDFLCIYLFVCVNGAIVLSDHFFDVVDLVEKAWRLFLIRNLDEGDQSPSTEANRD